MIKLKKIMALGLSALMVTSLVGCGEDGVEKSFAG